MVLLFLNFMVFGFRIFGLFVDIEEVVFEIFVIFCLLIVFFMVGWLMV